MAAVITSDINSVIVTGASRDDLRAGDVVNLSYVPPPAHTTYSWAILFAPKSPTGVPSAAVLTTPNAISCAFTVDNEGAYLIRLVVDLGLPSESRQEVRLRYITKFGKLKLVAGGEKRDTTGIIPVDQEIEGWANAQNFNLQKLQSFAKRTATSGRSFYVDANRGLNNATAQNVAFGVEDYADYSSIQTAINAAVASSPSPSLDSPYFIFVKPGFYNENVTFHPNVHVIGESGSDKFKQRAVVIRTTGASPFVHTTSGTFGAGDVCLLENLTLENVTALTNPVFLKEDVGTLYLKNCHLVQNGNSGTQGPALYARAGNMTVDSSFIQSVSVGINNRAILIDNLTSITPVHVSLLDTNIEGENGIEIAPSLFPACTCDIIRSTVTSTINNAAAYAVKSDSNLLNIIQSRLILEGASAVNALTIHPGAGIKGSDVIANVKHSILEGNIRFDATNLASAKELNLGAVEYEAKTIIGVVTETATVMGDTIFYDNTSSSAAWENVQQALDSIAAVFGNQGIGPSAFSLDTAYDGVVDALSDPPVIGSGQGRTILADQGSVQIIGADPPVLITGVDEQNGGLQVEGNLEVGAIDAAEIRIRPNPFSVGPSIEMGNLVWPEVPGSPDPHRPIPAATIQAQSTGSPQYHNYNLCLETQATGNSSNGQVGNVIVRGGDGYNLGSAAPIGGSVLLQAGHSNDDDGGEIFLMPGHNINSGVPGKIIIADPVSQTFASLQADTNFVGGVAGNISFYVNGYGLVTANILVGDNLAAVQAKLTALPGLNCSGNPLLITTNNRGPASDVIFAFDDVGGTLNTALGNFELPAATYTAGANGNTIEIECNALNTLQINGNLVVTGSISGATVLNRVTTSIDYTVLTTESYIGVNTLAAVANVAIYLPNTPGAGGVDGREIIIKDEGFNASVFNVNIQVGNPQSGLVDTLTVLPFNSNGQSVRLVCNGASGASCRWFVA